MVLHLGTFHFSHFYTVLFLSRLLTHAVGHLLLSVVTKVSKNTLLMNRSASAEITAIPLLFIFLFSPFLLTMVVDFTSLLIGNLSVAMFCTTTARQRTAQFQTTFDQGVRYLRADPIAH